MKTYNLVHFNLSDERTFSIDPAKIDAIEDCGGGVYLYMDGHRFRVQESYEDVMALVCENWESGDD